MVSSLLPTASFRFPSVSPDPRNKTKRAPPLTISTNPSHLDPVRIRELFHASGHSCHRFPSLGADGRPEPVDLDKLRSALAHSAVVASVFCRSSFLLGVDDRSGFSGFAGFDELFERAAPAPGPESRLVGFGRAVTDGGLTASIHDVVVSRPFRFSFRSLPRRIFLESSPRVLPWSLTLFVRAISDPQVIPSLQRLGIGRKIVQRILRFLTSRGIYDISAVCSKEERLFFQACGFGDDSLGSITMMYTQTTSRSKEENLTVKHAGRMLLLVPEWEEPCPSKTFPVQVE